MRSSSSTSRFSTVVERLTVLLLSLLALLFLVELALSLRWRLGGDSAFLHYLAYLINEHGFVPYRDLFELNMPGTYLFHMAVGNWFGYSDLAFRLVDVVWLSTTLGATWLMMQPMGRSVAAASALLFGLIYLGAGPQMSLQRDVIAILPIALALLLLTRRRPNQSRWMVQLLLGILFAMAALIKPHMAIGLPAVVGYSCIQDSNQTAPSMAQLNRWLTAGLFALIGFLAMFLLPFLWLRQIGALASFWEITSSYVPLYAEMARDFEFREPLARLLNLVYWYLEFGGFGTLLTAAIFGVNLVLHRSADLAQKRLAVLLLTLTLLYSIYVMIGGKFWPYHWMPCAYFASLGTAMLIFSPSTRAYGQHLLLPLVAFGVTTAMVSLLPAHDAIQQAVYGQPPPPPMEGRVDEIAAYLAEQLEPTEQVQPLAWISGATHGMLLAEAVVATSFVTDFQFYHHVSDPYIQRLRSEFLAELEEAMPSLIIEVYATPRVAGVDTNHHFPELRAFIEQHYQTDYTGNGFEIFRKNEKIKQ